MVVKRRVKPRRQRKVVKKKPKKKTPKAVVHTLSTRPKKKKTVRKPKGEVWFIRGTSKPGCDYYVKVYDSRREVYDAIRAEMVREKQPTPIRARYYKDFNGLVHDLICRTGSQPKYIEIETEGHLYNSDNISPLDATQYEVLERIVSLHRGILDTRKSLRILLELQ